MSTILGWGWGWGNSFYLPAYHLNTGNVISHKSTLPVTASVPFGNILHAML